MGENEELRQRKRKRRREAMDFCFTGATELKTDMAASNNTMCPTLPKKGKLIVGREKIKQQTHTTDTLRSKKHSMDLFAKLNMAKRYLEKALTYAAAEHDNLDSGGTEEIKKDPGSLLGCPCIQKNSQMNLELEMLRIELKRCKNQNRVNQKKLSEENQELKTKLNEMEEYNKNLMLKEQMSTHKMDEAQDEMLRLKTALDQMAGCNKYLMLREQMSIHKLDETNKELFTLKTKLHEMEENLDVLNKQLEAKTDDMEDMESLNQVYVVKERECNNELQEARKELISGWKNLPKACTTIGIKRMGELKKKPFRDVCIRKISNAEWDLKSAIQCSHWQERIEDPQWFPFKIIETNGKCEQIINENDDELKRLKNEWGNQVYKAVCAALAEVNEYNPSARYPVPELWNFREGRKAKLKEVVRYLLNLAKKQTCGVQQ